MFKRTIVGPAHGPKLTFLPLGMTKKAIFKGASRPIFAEPDSPFAASGLGESRLSIMMFLGNMTRTNIRRNVAFVLQNIVKSTRS